MLNSFLVTRAATTGGAVIDAFAYVWLTVYVAAFFPAAWAPFGVLVSAVFGAALLLADLPAMFTAWLLLTISVLTSGAVVSQVSRLMQGRMSTDVLTGALNRSGLQEAARRLHLRRRRDASAVTVAALDLDGFKAINDAGGHATGDRLLAEATAVLDRLRSAHPVAWSAGIADWRADQTLAECLEPADRELHAAKHAR
ncbi:MAG: diguanylate cyclase [Conexibacter sp.]|nr:diguanylate cyclase [Conexibacter sp.]